MSYEVTATRRRPKTFDELAGQEFVAATLKNSLEKGHIAHAYLFSGPRGCGKTSAARILARALRCEKGPAANPCGVCPQCEEVFRGASMDVLEIDGASNTGVNDVRQIKEEVLFPPSTGRYKVYIIDEVHMLSNSAFNALLKTIEEPPPNVVFIFATTELQKVPATIRSRCQQFNFRLVSVEIIAGLLRAACDETGVKAEDEALFWIARESTGSCRDAYTLFDQVLSFSGGNIRSDLIREKLGLVGLDKLNGFAESCAAGDFAGSLSLLDEVIASGVAAETFITDLAGFYHSLLLLKAGVTREAVLGYPPAAFSEAVLGKYDALRLERAGELLYALYRDIRYSVSPRFELETLVSKLCWLEKWISPVELADAVAGTRALLGGAPPPPSVGVKEGSGGAFQGGISPRAPSGNAPAQGGSAPRESDAAGRNDAGGNVVPSGNPAQGGSEAAGGEGAPPRGEASAGETGSLTEEFMRHMASRGSAGSPAPQAGTPSGAPSGAESDPGVRNVLSVIEGTVVNGNRA